MRTTARRRAPALLTSAPLLTSAFCLVPSAFTRAQSSPPFNVVEASIADVHAAFKSKRLTCVALVTAYLARINAYDKQGPSLNAVTVTNPDALKRAAELDALYAQKGLTGPLHCIPMVVKDNFETIGLQSANGSKSLEGFVSDKDAFQVARIKAAGAIVIAKTNMAEFAFSPQESLSSIQGHTRNPYDARSRAGRIERRHRGVRGGEFCDGRARQRHRQFDSRPVRAHRARRHSIDDGPDEPRGRAAAELPRRYRGSRWRELWKTP